MKNNNSAEAYSCRRSRETCLLLMRGILANTVRQAEVLLGVGDGFPVTIHLAAAYDELEKMIQKEAPEDASEVSFG